MKELDNEMIEELRYFESINGNFTYNFVKKFIDDYSTWEAVEVVEGCLLDNYFLPVESEEIFGVGFIEKYVNPNMSEYRVEVYYKGSLKAPFKKKQNRKEENKGNDKT